MIEDVIRRLGDEVGLTLPDVRVTGEGDPILPTAFKIGTVAAATTGAVAAAVALYGAGRAAPDVAIDVRAAVAHFLDERYFRVDGVPAAHWAPLSGDYRAADGWIRVHANFDHHLDAALRALGLPPGADRAAVEVACAGRAALEMEEMIVAAGGCAAAMRTREQWHDHPQSRAVAAEPLIRLRPMRPAGRPDTGSAPGRPAPAVTPGSRRNGGAWTGGGPLGGVRVLDLTRVIAGPVAGRALAAYGAEVLRVGAAHLPEVPGLVLSTAFGKRSCELDLRTEDGAAALRELIAGADVVLQAYRPGALAALGFGPGDLAAIRPGIVCVEISAYGPYGPWAARRGFDSLVQMACGIAHEGGDGTRPVPLPAQALDHATGWLAALAALAGLLRREPGGPSWHVRLSLARTALWLDRLGRAGPAPAGAFQADDLLARLDSPHGELTYLPVPGSIDGWSPGPPATPPSRGEHPPRWR
ncbi:CoA transferase [Sphaerisporangium rufum]|uniref:CoA transferase n=1 Tax=Sphaerisporangium rufum TaxID=1381558 RepID=UPI00195297F3|nr:CoA transferase [Sphaerisporangium rufum]